MHPISLFYSYRDITARGVTPHNDLDEFKTLPGHGIIARVGDARITVGAETVVETAVATLRENLRPGAIWAFASVSSDCSMRASIALVDGARPEVRAFVAQLHDLRVRPVVLLTGDAEDTARHVAGIVGVDQLHWRLLPERKVAQIQQLREQYGTVAMLAMESTMPRHSRKPPSGSPWEPRGLPLPSRRPTWRS